MRTKWADLSETERDNLKHAHDEGKQIQCVNYGGEWVDVPFPNWWDHVTYRAIGKAKKKAAPKPRPPQIQDAMAALMFRDCGDFTPDQICRALHAALAGDVEKALACINERK